MDDIASSGYPILVPKLVYNPSSCSNCTPSLYCVECCIRIPLYIWTPPLDLTILSILSQSPQSFPFWFKTPWYKIVWNIPSNDHWICHTKKSHKIHHFQPVEYFFNHIWYIYILFHMICLGLAHCNIWPNCIVSNGITFLFQCRLRTMCILYNINIILIS